MNEFQPEKPKVRALLADDEPGMREVLQAAMRSLGIETTEAKNGDEALFHLRRQRFDLVICDYMMPRVGGMEVLQFAKSLKPSPPFFIMITGKGTMPVVVKALREGVNDFIPKPFEIEEFIARVRNALDTISLKSENRTLRRAVESRYVFTEIIGESRALRKTIDLAQRASEQSSPVLLLGESGTGKDLFARTIHFHGPRQKKQFIAINCGAIPANLIESEFFGHKRGAFTGAVANRLGCFEEVDGGTIFLDEIGEMPLDLQVRLLRVLEAKTIRRIGENIERPVDFRIIAATNRSLQQAVDAGAFRQDLFYRLNVFSIEIPSLRERREDIEPLTYHFLQKAQEDTHSHVSAVSKEALQLLEAYEYPGNVRELNNILHRAILLCEGDVLEPEHLPEEIQALRPRIASGFAQQIPMLSKIPGGFEPLSWNLDEETRRIKDFVEQTMIERALVETNGNKERAASLLGIRRSTLYNKIKQMPGLSGAAAPPIEVPAGENSANQDDERLDQT